mgnify:CR=1 FL=1
MLNLLFRAVLKSHPTKLLPITVRVFPPFAPISEYVNLELNNGVDQNEVFFLFLLIL